MGLFYDGIPQVPHNHRLIFLISTNMTLFNSLQTILLLRQGRNGDATGARTRNPRLEGAMC